MSQKANRANKLTTEAVFRLKPLTAYIRALVAGGLFAGTVTPSYAELPVPFDGAAFVSSGSATNQVLGNTLRIDQQSDKAILNWHKFNVGKENTVQFVQPGSASIALNRINQADPSRIFGQIKANGQIYLYNQNGFVFGKDSVVNANSVLASTLNISDEVFNRGITRVFDEDGRAALAIEPMKPGASMDPKSAAILIEAGAKIHTDKSGRIIIAAPTIVNKGSLSADEQGQVILTASQDKVYLQAANKNSPFTGLLVEVDTGGKVENVGNILAKQGNVTMSGFLVKQEGRVSATTSVNVGGSVRLLAQEKHGSVSGNLIATSTKRTSDLNDGLGTQAKVTFGSGSVTQIVADNDGATAIDEQKQPQSYLEAKGHTVELQSDSAIVAPGGKVDISATDVPDSPLQGTTGRIYMDKNALIDVSGYKGVKVPMERNVAEISVQSYELRNSPLQKTGVLKGETIKVDLRKEHKIVDVGGAKARIQRGVEERLGTGGEVDLTSSGDVVIKNGAKINISGGYVDYQDGYINSTKLLDDYGKIVDISDADPKQHYASIFGVIKQMHKKWGVEEVWNILDEIGSGQFEQGYRQGLAAGAVNIKTPRLSWNGDLIAGSSSGLYQRRPADHPDGGSFLFDSTAYSSSVFQDVRFQTEKDLVTIGLDDPFPKTGDNKPQALVLPTQLTNQSGAQQVTVKTRGEAAVASGTKIEMMPGSEFSIQAGKIDVDGQVRSPAGTIDLAIVDSLSTIKLGGTASLDVSGRWVNDFQQGKGAKPLDPLYIDGGTVKIRSVGDLFLETGSKISADGGAWLAQNEEVSAGKGGGIELAAVGEGVSSLVHLDGEISAASLSQGGSLTLSSGEIVVGTAASKTTNPLAIALRDGRFAFDPDYTFGEVNLIGNLEGVTIASDAKLDLKTQNWMLTSDYRENATGGSIGDFADLVLLPEHLRQPFSLSVFANNDINVATGSSIITDKESTVNLESALGSIYVDGIISAPAGTIKMSINPLPNSEYEPSQTVRLGTNAQLLARATTRLNPIDSLGSRTGDVLDGGNIEFDLKRGYFIAEKGSMLDVSGTSAVLDLLHDGIADLGKAKDSSQANNLQARNSNIVEGARIATPVKVASNAGNISIAAAEGAVLDGEMRASSGSPTTSGGRFSLSLDNTRRLAPPLQDQNPSNLFPDNPLLVRIVENQQNLFDANIKFGDKVPAKYNGQAVAATEMLEKGGFSDVRFTTPDEIRFEGNVNLATKARIDLDTGKIGWAGLNGETSGIVNLDTAMLRLGSSQNREVFGLPEIGVGQFKGSALWTELFGATRWDNFSQIDLNSTHDIRTVGLRTGSEREFLGGMETSANLSLNASQVYPTTLSQFKFAVKNNPNGQINITGNDTDKSPLSAAGVLSFEAPFINQSGVVKAPFGSINFKAGSRLTLAENSLTSVSAAGQTIPFGVTQGGLDWLYPLDSIRNLVFSAPPEKKLLLEAPEVILAKGSKIDLSGGGDLKSYEFLPGLGGDYDYLQPDSLSYQGGFAVVPNLGSDLAPYDHFQYTNNKGSELGIGGKVYLSGTADLPAGEYTKLPAHYALLPGAFLVTPQANTHDQAFTTRTTDGLPIVAGFNTVAGTRIRDSRSSAFLIESGKDVRKNTEYEEHLANDFFTAKALKNESALPILPKDSGQISIVAQNKLILDSQFMVDAVSGGRGALMDIAADKINVVNQFSIAPATGTLEILASDLSELNVDSLLLGGSRSRNGKTGETDLNVSAQSVVFSSGSKLQVSDMMAAATDLINVEGGTELAASGKVNSGDSKINVVGDGALLRISGDKQVTLNRTNAPNIKGDLIVAPGSNLSASGSMLLEASNSTVLEGDILMRGGSLNLSASAINMGEIPGLSGNALNLTNQKLLNLSVDELILNSRGALNFYGNVGQVDSNNNPILANDGLQEPIKFDRLVVNAAGLSGFGAAGQTARLQANNLVLENPKNAVASAGIGEGRLDLMAENLAQGAGTFAINGFSGVNVNVKNGLSANGSSVLNVGSDLNLNVGYLATAGGSNIKFDATGHTLQVNGHGNPVSAVTAGFGGAVEFIADNVAFDAKAFLPSGKLNLHALTRDVVVGSAADIDLAGKAVSFANKTEYTPGGAFTAIADNGTVTLASGSKLDLSKSDGSALGGNLVLKAPKQSITLAGEIKASGGSADFDVSNFNATTSFDSLMAVLKNAGVSDSIYLRSRDADIVQSLTTEVTANKITLAADKGSVDIFGQLHADDGGQISLYAGDNVILENNAVVTAKGQKGGSVLLSSVDSDNDNVSGIDLKMGSQINVSGGTAENGGEVSLRALRNGNGINIQPIAGAVQGYSKLYAEGVKKYNDADGFITSSDIAAIKADTDAYMAPANMLGVANALGGGIRLKAGVQLDHEGDLVLMDKWDFIDWRYNEGNGLSDLPGNLSLNATGNITLNASISDGFKDGSIYFNTITVNDLLQPGDSWSYQVTAGLDLSAADRQTASADKNLEIGSNVSVRTGSGDLKLVSGGNIRFTDDTSTVYSAGRPTETERYGTLNALTVGFLTYGEYPVEGGDLVLKAGKNIDGALTSQFISPWLIRQGNWTANVDHTGENPTAWAVALGYIPNFVGNAADSSSPLFRQNVGSFGGGKVDVFAAGNINDLSVMMPTTGKQIGLPVAAPDDPNPSSFDFITNRVQVNGGGEMRVSAGGDIAGGAYFLGQGEGSLFADGAIKGGSQFTSGPQLVMGDAKIDLLAKNGFSLSGISDPMIIHSGDINFFSYGNRSAVNIKALSGDVHLGSDVTVIDQVLSLGSTQKALAQIYPGTLESTAFEGSVILDNEIIVFPSAKARLNLLAAQDITSASGDVTRLGMSDADPALMPTFLSPVTRNNMNDTSERISPFGLPTLVHAPSPLHAGDNEPATLVASKGDIKNIQFNLAKKALIQTGRDFSNVLLSIQHPNQDDSSVINIGRDLFYTSDRSPDGALNNNPGKIEVAGSGDLLVKTGRHLDLGASGGISTLGDIAYSGLADLGANITVITGLNNGEPDYPGFIDKYLQNNPLYAKDFTKVAALITDFMRQRSGNNGLTNDQALAGFKTLKAEDYLQIQPQLAALILPPYMNEIRESGSASAKPGASLANERGYDAIETLFPGTKWSGDLSLFFSKIQTLDGGGINLLVPGGKINAGLAVAFTGSKSSSELGIVAQKEGAINAVVRDDFLVNQSRVFALGGDDITLWSSNEDIDAGKGAKSAIAAPPPIISFDENGNLVIEFPPIVQGSGIRTASTTSGVLPGDVFLFAPKGVVNAGEAGIGGNNVTISATAVLGANNIQVGGVATGVPTASTGSLAAGLTGTSNLTASVNQVAEASVAADNDKNSKLGDTVLGMVTVDILGFGESQ